MQGNVTLRDEELKSKDDELAMKDAELEYLNSEMIKQKNELELITTVILEGEARMQAILENFVGEIWSIDSQYKLSHANSHFFRICKARGIHLQLGETILDALTEPKEREQWRERYGTALKGQKINLIEQRSMPEGIVYIEIFLNPIRTETGRVIGVTGLNIDVTERIEAEKEQQRLHKELNRAAHRAGMADVATGVLHNVGNILNSVNTSSVVILETTQKSATSGLQKANELLRKNMGNLGEFLGEDPKGMKLLEYYFKLEKRLILENAVISENSSRLVEKVEAINNIITAQQDYAKTVFFSERLSLQDVAEEALELLGGTLEKENIVIEKELDRDVPQLILQKSKLIQVLINLFKNAMEAMRNLDNAEKTLIIKTHEDEGYAYIRVSDSGSGIAAQELQKIFTHGFTTKRNGHGFGLHASANSMTEMDGKMWAESAGKGKGAMFVLQFPIPASDHEKSSSR